MAGMDRWLSLPFGACVFEYKSRLEWLIGLSGP